MTTQTLIHPLLHNRLLSIRIPRLNFKFFWILGFGSVLFFIGFYAFQVQEIIKNNYLIKDYERRIREASQENKVLEINLAHSNSLENVEKVARELNFEKIKEVKYIQVLETSLAQSEKLAH